MWPPRSRSGGLHGQVVKRLSDQTRGRRRRGAGRTVSSMGHQAGGLRAAGGKSGTKTFVARYRADGGGRTAPRRFATIGRFGVLTVDEARKHARMLLGAAAKGDDPPMERQARRREMTMSALIDLYEAEGCFVQRGIRQGEPMKARTRAYTLARLRHHVFPCSATSASLRSMPQRLSASRVTLPPARRRGMRRRHRRSESSFEAAMVRRGR